MVDKVYPVIRTDTLYVERKGFVSPRVNGAYATNNGYTSLYSTASGGRGAPPGVSFNTTDSVEGLTSIPTSTYNRVYSKFLESASGSKGELMTSVLEWNSSLEMITRRATQLKNAYQALRRFNLPEVAHHLSMGKRQRRIVEGKIRKMIVRPAPSSLWLEYWMGWAPLIGDIHHAMDTLSRPVTGFHHLSEGVGFECAKYQRTYGSNAEWSTFWYQIRAEAHGRLAFYGRVQVINHNLYLANALGFTNPALTAWQIVPFSFIVDWFTNVGQFIGSLTDFAGLRVDRCGYGLKKVSSGTKIGYVRERAYSPARYYSLRSDVIEKKRIVSPLRPPQLTIGLPKLSLTRAATAVSLLVEIFLLKK